MTVMILGWMTHLGQSIYLREVLGREEGAPPPVDLACERRNGDFVRNLINSSQVTAVHDISDGGLGLSVIEMAMAGNLGASLVHLTHEHLFGEDQARYVVTAMASEAAKIITQAQAAGVGIIRIGSVTAEPSLNIAGAAAISVADLRTAHESWFPAFMAGEL